MNKKYIGFWYLLSIYVLGFIVWIGTKKIDVSKTNWFIMVGVFYVLTRFALKPFVARKYGEGGKILRFIPVLQEYVLMENVVMKAIYISVNVLAIMAIFIAYGVADLVFPAIGVTGIAMSTYIWNITIFAIVMLLASRILVAITLIPHMWNDMVPLNSLGFQKSVNTFMKILSAILLFIPFLRNFALAYMVFSD